jgi:hypothetical protein
MFIIIVHPVRDRMFDGTTELFDDCEFPATCDDVVAAVGDAELELPNGTESAADAIERGGGDAFQTREDAALALASGVGRAAIGRSHYSDRDPTTLGDDGPRQVSF